MYISSQQMCCCRSWLTDHPAVTAAIVETEVVVAAPVGLVVERMRRRSGCPAPNLAVSYSRYTSFHIAYIVIMRNIILLRIRDLS